MNAKLLTNGTPSGSRSIIGEILPLDSPLLVQIFPVYACNFKCSYCFHALPKKQRGYDCNKTTMDFELYKKCIDDLMKFPHKIKMLRIAGLGEPLLHPQIADMVRYAKQSESFGNVNIVTNASLLTKELSLNLINAGLDMLRISIQGMSAQRYSETSAVDINFDKFLDNIRFFYEHRGNTKVYIKIIDCALKNDKDKQKFFDCFGNICDLISVECMTPTVGGIDYEKISGGNDLNRTQNGNVVASSNICSMPFYMMQINPDGMIVPCCGWQIPTKVGNVKEQSLAGIWDGGVYNAFRAKMLSGASNCGRICSECTLYRYGLFTEDMLDDYAEKLLPIYKKASEVKA